MKRQNPSSTSAFLLPAGISGFFETGTKAPPLLNFEDFARACEKAGNLSNFSLRQVYNFNEQPARSYHAAVFFRDTTLLALCNKYFPVVAFARIANGAEAQLLDHMPENEYVNVPELSHIFEEGFTVLDKTGLTITVDADVPEDALAVSLLSDNEFAEFAYWEPKIVADIIFNNWG